MKETIIFLESGEKIEPESLQFLWAASYSQSPIRTYRIKDVKESQNILDTIVENSGLTIKKLPSVVYNGRLFSNLKSLGTTISRDLKTIIASGIISKVKDNGTETFVNFNGKKEKITLDEDYIEEHGGASFNTYISFDEKENVEIMVWLMNEDRYIKVFPSTVTYQ